MAAALGVVSGAAARIVEGQAPTSKQVFDHRIAWSKLEINDFGDAGTWGWGIDGIVRRKSIPGDGSVIAAPLRESVRPWVHYQFGPYARLSVSPLGYFNTNEYAATPAELERPSYRELRSTVQFFHHAKQLDGRLMHTWRYRYELRFQERAGLDDWRRFDRFRFRYRARFALNGNDFYENGVIYAMVSNEIGLNIGRQVVWNTFNQNRVYAGLGMRFANSARAELRYVDQFRTRGATGFQFDHGRGVMLAMYVDQWRTLGSRDNPVVRFFD